MPATTLPPQSLRHSAHDFGLLMQRWDKVARQARLAGLPLGEAWDLPIWGLETAAAAAGEKALYLSAGVHGDEPAGAWALLQWAEANTRLLRTGAYLLVPCFNPEGFIGNTRTTSRGVDINRAFDDDSDPLMKTWQAWIRTRSLSLAVCLHEDYDAQGCYVYELSGRNVALSEKLLRPCSRIMKRDTRREIDGNAAKNGIIRRERIPQHVKGPEAIILRQLGCPATLTFETASELSLDTRVAVQRCFIEQAVASLQP